MSLKLETLNRGAVENFGYSYGGVHRVLLGELPAMPTPQFCKMAGNVLLEISEKLDEQDWILLGERLQLAFTRDEQTKVDRESVFDLPEDLADRLNRASLIANLIIQNGWTAEAYQYNPFTVKEDRVLIGEIYEFSFLEFGSFVAQILAGGLFGWDQEKGVPKAAKEIIAKLRHIW